MYEPRLIKIGKAARILGTTPGTLRKWEETGELLPTRKTKGGTRYYDAASLMGLEHQDVPTIAYARVSSHDQKDDLTRQGELLAAYCAKHGWRFELISDLGSGMNYGKKGLKRLLEMILRKQLCRLVLTHKDRLLQFGAELVFTLCEHQGIEIVVINQGEQPSFEEELAQDVLEIITVFSARLYGARSHQHQKTMDALQDVARP
ncbi:MAG: IS607 family transposase [Gammaproteobacteria bacterium]|nr:IS607 family transposase [Gammaproteobacteria bacterium]